MFDFCVRLLLLMTGTGHAGQMAFPGEHWDVASPESQGINSLRLTAAIDSLGKDFNLSGRSLAIVRNGRMVWQSPQSNRHIPCDQSRSHSQVLHWVC